MITQVPLDEDHHVHSVFSDDAISTLAENVAAARQRGLRALCLADHVRRDSAWVPDFLAAVDALRPVPGLDVLAGVEAKILDRTGRLDLPEGSAGADRVLIADHQFPADLGPVHPREMRAAIAAGEVTAEEVIGGLIEATAGALTLAARPQLAHLFSILPKMGLAESSVPDQAIGHLARQARVTGALLEVNEKWACPSASTVRAFAAAGVPLVASTDSVALRWVLVGFVMVGAVPLVAAAYQFSLVAFHFRRNHYPNCTPYFPRTAILVPAWNEAMVIGASIDRLMKLNYPPEALRVFVVDDASTDDTPDVILAKAAEYPGQVFHLRRQKGGEGKSHTLNHGLGIILEDDWMQAPLIMDADVIYEPDSLRMMTRHLSDPTVGAVTAYIKEGSRPGNYLTRFIGFEYITAQAAARRSQNVLGAVACLAGGAQLHSRANIEAIGGRIDTSSLAEDTFTTFRTQLAGNRVIFEPHATVWAEEPGDIGGLWKQRLRWARGNVQVTKQFAGVWCRPSRVHRLGSVSFSVFWFCLFLLPLVMILASASLIILYFADFPMAWVTFHLLWIINALTYVFITSYVIMIGWQARRHTWLQGILFPGIISVAIIIAACFPGLLRMIFYEARPAAGLVLTPAERRSLVLFAYAWLALSMVVAYLGKIIEPRRFGRLLSPAFIYIAGYGPLLCACTFASYVKELRGAEMTWDKTEKTGKVAMPI